ncbi:MAG: InlB B-repeat-containing protein [Bacilli bacterium]|nr:InlB B-repeat-containing protein [Bacilli bacterium]
MMKKKSKYFLIILLLLLPLFLLLSPVTFSKYTNSISKTVNITFSRPEYTIKFDANGGTGLMSDMSITRGVSQTLTSNSFTRSGYDFIGWNTESDGSGISYADGQEMAYASLTDGEVITLYAQWYNKDYITYSVEEENYTCTEDVKTFTAPRTGRYTLEAWGAQGGSVSDNVRDTKVIPAVEGGRGGYSYAIVNLNAGDVVYVAVGCQGVEVKNSVDGTIGAGGYNGGGQAMVDGTLNYSGSGGGATHFAINHNYGELKNYSDSQSDILLVAGGGGGSYNSSSIYYQSYGGYGGGMIAGDSISYYNVSYRSGGRPIMNTIYGFVYYQGLSVPGADQTLHTGADFVYGSFGQGVDAIRNISGTDSGSGGGWYGGNRLTKANSTGGMAGSGGSGHINTTDLKYIEGKTIAGNLQIPTHDGSSYMTGNTGDGYARISFVNPQYTVKFDANGGTGTMSDMDFVYGTAQNLTANAFTKNNYKFVEWNTERDGSGTAYDDEELVNNLTSTYDDEITLYAQWAPPRIYFEKPDDWYGDVYVYMFNSVDRSNVGWPPSSSYSTALVSGTSNVYYYVLSDNDMAAYDRVVFTNGQNIDISSGLNSNARQTVDTELKSHLYGKKFTPSYYSGEGTRVFFRSGSSWTPHIHYWNSNDGTVWPGPEFTEHINEDTYLYVIPAEYNKMIFNKGTGGTGNQTADLDVPSQQDMTYNLNSGPYRIFYDGSWSSYSE